MVEQSYHWDWMLARATVLFTSTEPPPCMHPHRGYEPTGAKREDIRTWRGLYEGGHGSLQKRVTPVNHTGTRGSGLCWKDHLECDFLMS